MTDQSERDGDARSALEGMRDLERLTRLPRDRASEELQQAVNGTYTSAVRAMSQCRGKIILTGVGKSGLVAQKIASTMASTGTPALYLHPSEAMHGGLGLVGPSANLENRTN